MKAIRDKQECRKHAQMSWSEHLMYKLRNNQGGTYYNISSWFLLILSSWFLIVPVWGQGLTIPVGSTVNVNTGTLDVGGEVDLDGTLVVTTGTVRLIGNWDNAGTYIAGTGTTDFNGTAGTQTINSGGTGVNNDFFDLTHSGTGTLQTITSAVDVDNDVNISAGTWDLNGQDVTVEVDWNQSGAGAISDTLSTSTITLDGTNQAINGSTASFHNLTKIGNNTLTLEGLEQQTITGMLTLMGTGVGTELTIVSDNTGVDRHQIFLANGGLQDLEFLDVSDGDATNLDLVARNSNNIANNDTGSGSPEWVFGAATFVWDGDISTDWNTPGNWDLGLVPSSIDSAIIPDTSAGSNRYPSLILVPGATVTVNNLTLSAAVSDLSLDGKNLTVTTTFSNDGNVNLFGSETVTFTQDINSGTFTYEGDVDNMTDNFTITDFGATDYFNLRFIDATGTFLENFLTGADLTVANDLTITSANFDSSTGNDNLTIGNDLIINNLLATVNTANSSIDVNGDFNQTAGTFTAPITGEIFTIAGDFTQNTGTFTAGTGAVTLDGTSQTLSADGTAFNTFTKITANGTLIVDSTVAATPTFSGNFTLQGTAGNLMTISSSTLGAQAPICMLAGAIQNHMFLDVNDSNAGPNVACLTQIARGAGSDVSNNTNNWALTSTFTWQGDDGTTPTNWDTPQNWDLGLVPSIDDTVDVPNVANDPVLASNTQIENFTLQTGATLTGTGFNFTVDMTFSNDGTLTFRGNETITLTGGPDINSGAFTFIGTGAGINIPLPDFGAGVDYFNLNLAAIAVADTFQTGADLNVAGTLTLTTGGLDISTGSDMLTVAGNFDMDGGTVSASSGTIDLNGSFDQSGGTFTAPGVGQTFTVADDWLHSGGTFTANGGTVTFDTITTATFTGDTTFFNFTSTIPGKTLLFTNGTNQTITGTLTMGGTFGSLMTIDVVGGAAGDQWNITPTSAQNVSFLDVDNSDALTNTITCFNCTDGGDNNVNWIFETLIIDVPLDTRTVDTTPTIIGRASIINTIEIKDMLGTTIATTIADTNGNFRVEVPVAMAVGADTLTAFIGAAFSNTVNITVDAAPSAALVPTITSHADGDRVQGDKPTIVGAALASDPLEILASDANGLLLLSTVATDTVSGAGAYSTVLTTALPKGINDISVTVNGVASEIVSVLLTDPFGIIFDSTTFAPIAGASIEIIRASDGQPAVIGVDLDLTDTNPVVVGANGLYSFFTINGDYFFRVTEIGHLYPSVGTSFPPSFVIVAGSKGETFTINNVVQQIDQPMDPLPNLIRIEKDANKSEISVGGVVTYTITAENISGRRLSNIFLQDTIPAGFKYLEGRVTLDGVPFTEPTGGRPLTFPIGSFETDQTKVLKYQLVVGAGVTFGDYVNSARAEFSNDVPISNTATETVEVVPDPLFDLSNVIGKVFYDYNENGIQDPPEYVGLDRREIREGPVPNVRIVMEDGTVITTDRFGQFHVPAILPGRHLLRLDERSLADGSYLTTDKVVVIDFTPGTLFKVNFGVNMDTNREFSEDEVFFAKKVNVTQDKDRVNPRLHVSLFNGEITTHNEAFIESAEFRIFTNYAPFIETWKLEIQDKNTKKLLRRFEGNRFSIHDPVFWDGRDYKGDHIRFDRNYEYVVYVEDAEGNFDETKGQEIIFKDLTENKQVEEYLNQKEERQKTYSSWSREQAKLDSIFVQTILIDGETVYIDRTAADIKAVRIMEGGQLTAEVPVTERHGLTAQELIEGKFAQDVSNQEPLEIILPRGDYQIVIQEEEGEIFDLVPESVTEVGRIAEIQQEVGVPVKTYGKNIKVGEDYLMFVAMGDAKIGYTITRGNIEPARPDDKFVNGFWQEGKLAYYIKGKIKGKYLLTSSFDSERERKELFRNLNEDDYYPVYGDESDINYDATNTQGNLYLMLEWDKSSVQWSNYSVNFDDTEFAQYSRTLYGGKLDLESLSKTKFGDSSSKVILYRARAQQKNAHNEFLGTGGSLYFLKHKEIIEGSDQLKIEVRDKITGIVKSAKEMKEGADYELDYRTGRILFWQPVSILAASQSIISDELLDGDPLYVVVDYEYDLKDKFDEDSFGTRVRGAITDNVLGGVTYVSDRQEDTDYQLRGTDLTVKLSKDAKVVAEFAQSESGAAETFVSTDGGLSFTELSVGDGVEGQAYGIRGDARLFNRLGIESFYKWVDNEFSTSATTAQQGKEVVGFYATYDFTDVTRLSTRYDLQNIIDDGNAQTQVQVGSNRSETTLVQFMHTFRKLRVAAEYRRDKSTTSDVSTTAETIAIQSGYDFNDKLSVDVTQQIEITDENQSDKTTINVVGRPASGITLHATEVIGEKGYATTFGIESDVGKETSIGEKLTVLAEYSLIAENTGTFGTGGTLGAIAKINENMEIRSTYGRQTTATEDVSSMVFGTTTTTEDGSTLSTDLEFAESLADQTRKLIIAGSSKVDDKTTTTTAVSLTESALSGRSTNYTFGTDTKLTEAISTSSSRTFGVTEDGSQTQGSTYGLTRSKDGKSLSGTLTRSVSDGDSQVSRSNIFGLTGALDDRWAVKVSYERADVQNLDGTDTERDAVALSVGYVKKDPETGVQMLKSSTKVEARIDKGDLDRRQMLFYNSTEGKLTPELTLFTEVEFSNTRNLSDSFTESSHRELVVGGSYRPIYNDRFNFLGRYTYLEDQGPEGQTNATSDVERTRAHVVSAEGIYDLSDQWQISSKYAYRISEEKVPGFDFTKTHTWLMIQRLNYKINRDWLVGGEYRMLMQREAQDVKRGLLIEGARRLGEFAQLGVGFNFTDFDDEITHLDYSSFGPFIRMTGTFYDRTPEEAERARQRWIDLKIARWAWIVVNQEIQRDDGPIVEELNTYYALASAAAAKGDLEESQRIYKDIIMAGELMYIEASEYIRKHIKREEKLQEMQQLADQYIRNAQYEQAKKILEKILVEAEKGMLK